MANARDMFAQIPPVTRYYATASFLTTLASVCMTHDFRLDSSHDAFISPLIPCFPFSSPSVNLSFIIASHIRVVTSFLSLDADDDDHSCVQQFDFVSPYDLYLNMNLVLKKKQVN